MIRLLLSWLTGGGATGILDRALDTVDKRIAAETDRDKIKADILREHMRTRGDWMKAGGFWTLLLFAIPTAIHYGAVIVYSILWCAGCAYPQSWSIAALPGLMAQWEGYIILASIGGLALLGARR
jgi:hypothetical protein